LTRQTCSLPEKTQLNERKPALNTRKSIERCFRSNYWQTTYSGGD
jgi:hypothetical protein